MGLLHARTELQHIHTKLIPDQWESMLRRLRLWGEFGDVPEGLRTGFRIGAPLPALSTYVPPNHKSATLHPHVIEEHILSELAAGRYAGPFSQDTLEDAIGPFRCAPLGVVDKASAPGKFRVVQDFSFPREGTPHSLNSCINTDSFTCEWDMFPDVAKAVALAPPGSVAATCDVDAAYQQMPVHPLDRHHLIVHWNGKYFTDKCVPFGAASSNGVFGRCGDAAKRIYTSLGFGQIFKWVDDFIFLQSPPATKDQSAHNLPFASIEAIYDIANQLGWPWKTSKTRPFSNVFNYLGFEWDIANHRVSIPASKKEKYLARISKWRSTNQVSLKETQEVIGCLVHCALAIPSGRPRLQATIAFLASFPHAHSKRFHRRPIPTAVTPETDWWSKTLAHPNCSSLLPTPSEPIPLRIMSDASASFGIGVIVGNNWWSWKLSSGWKKPGKDIGWAEAIALEFAIAGAIAHGTRDCTIQCHCNNQGVVHAWAAGRSRNAFQNAVLLQAMSKAWEAGLVVHVSYIRSKDNLADAPSRGVPPKHPLHPGRYNIPMPHDLTHLLFPATLAP